MSDYILIGIDPYEQPSVDRIYKFKCYKDAYDFIEQWLKDQFDKNNYKKQNRVKDNFINSYLNYFKNNRYIHFNSYHIIHQNHSQSYDYKWQLFQL